jgi:hypothetical protein
MIHADKFTVFHTNVLYGPYLACETPGCQRPLIVDLIVNVPLSTLVSAAEAHWNKEHAAKEQG